MPTARHLLVASLSLLAASAVAQTHFAWVGTDNPNGEGLHCFTVSAAGSPSQIVISTQT